MYTNQLHTNKTKLFGTQSRIKYIKRFIKFIFEQSMDFKHSFHISSNYKASSNDRES